MFQSLKGDEQVDQGIVSFTGKYTADSEAVIVNFYPDQTTLATLIEIDLNTLTALKDPKKCRVPCRWLRRNQFFIDPAARYFRRNDA